MNSLREVTKTAFTPATPENIRTVFDARFALIGIVMLIFTITFLIVLLIDPPL